MEGDEAPADIAEVSSPYQRGENRFMTH